MNQGSAGIGPIGLGIKEIVAKLIEIILKIYEKISRKLCLYIYIVMHHTDISNIRVVSLVKH